MSVSAAKSRVMQARAQMESGRTQDVAATLDAAEKFLADDPPDVKAPILAEIRAIRAELGTTMSPDDRRALSGAQGKMRQARTNVADDNFFGIEDILVAAEGFLAAMTCPPTPEMIAMRAEIADLRARSQGLKPRAVPAPSASVGSASSPGTITTQLTPSQHGPAPVAQAPAPAAHAAVLVEPPPVDVPPVTWEVVSTKQRVGNTWGDIHDSIRGWEHEALTLDARPLEEPPLPKTREAVVRIGYLLRDPQTRANRADPMFDAVYRAAEQTFDAAAAQLDKDYHAVLAAAEAMPTPRQHALLDRPNQLAVSANLALHGTTYRNAVVARAVALDARWQAEVAALWQPRQAQLAAATRAADAAWPAIMARTDVQPELDPTKLAARGKTVLLAGAINRAGWEIAGRDYDFAIRIGNLPLAGAYEPHVRAALDRAWNDDHLEVSERVPWDVIAVVEGPDTIGERTLVTFEDAETHLGIGLVEQWRTIVCIRLRIIALRAGPVAVGP